MSNIRSVALIFIIFVSSASANQSSNARKDPSNDVLVFAHVIYRHGDRNINFICPNKPQNEADWPGGYGQLTNEGKRRHFKLGQYLRKRYNTLIGNKSFHNVYIQSTDVDRAIMSAQANLAGLFYPSAEEKWHDNILWQPIPLHSVPKKFDNIIFAAANCPKYKAAFDSYIEESSELKRIYAEYAEQFQFWSEMCGLNISSARHVLKLFKTLNIENEQNKTLADWAKKAIERNGIMENIAVLSYKVQTNTTQLARLNSGFLIKDMLDHFSMKINATLQPDRSLWIYSAHEFVIISFLHSLGLFTELHLPPYASSLHFELYKIDGNEHYVQLFYKQFDEEDLSPLEIPKCGEKCPLNKFYELYSDIIPGDFDSECHLTE